MKYQNIAEEGEEYIVTFKVDMRLPVSVRAKNFEEAKKKAYQEFGYADLSKADFVNGDIVSIEDKDGNLTDLI